MGDIDDRNTPGFQLSNDIHQEGNLVDRQGGGGFIHDQNFYVAAHGFGDFNDLHIGGRIAANAAVGIHIYTQIIKNCFRFPGALPVVDDEFAGTLIEKNILCTGHLWNQVEFLIDDLDPKILCLLRKKMGEFFPVDFDGSCVGTYGSGNTFDERGLTGTIFTQ